MEIHHSRFIIISAPSGSGKTTLVHALMDRYPYFEFSISATTRSPRSYEINGHHYHFMTVPEFKDRIENEEFIEYEEVYEGRYYGTLKSEIKRIHQAGKTPLLDIDVVGGINVKEKFQDKALSIFIQTPSLDELERRLRKRGSDQEEEIQKRLKKAAFEMTFKKYFDATVINDDLEAATDALAKVVLPFLNKEPKKGV
ncbi:MAG: guanylate kinase [Bacteroidota bacterium]